MNFPMQFLKNYFVYKINLFIFAPSKTDKRAQVLFFLKLFGLFF